MQMVIDAQIIKGYFQEDMGISESSLTGLATPIFSHVGKEDHIYLDEGGHIKKEWRDLVDPDWFDAWYPILIRDGGASEIPTETCNDLRKKIVSLGFPSKGKDIWYVRVGKSVTKLFDAATILTEDLDFYAPSKKKCTRGERLRILHSGKGPICNYLKRTENICVKCVANYP
jgi:hypothetical protein